MSLSAREIAEVCAELYPLAGALVQRAFVPERRTAVLALRRPGETHLLLVSAEPGLTRLHLVADRPRAAGAPAPLQAGLRAELEGLRLEAVDPSPGDRVVRLVFGGRHGRTLVAELFGRRGNLFLLDEDGRILQVAAAERSRRRDVRPGRRWTPPGAAPAADEAPTPAPAARSRFAGAGGDAPFPVNAAVAAHYVPLAEAQALEARRRALQRPVKAALGRLERALSRLDAEAARAAEAETYKRYGELLKPVLHEIDKGAATARVVDWYADGTPEVEIPLKPNLSPKENLERYFKLYRKLEAAPGRIAGRRQALEAARPALRHLAEALSSAADAETLEALAREAVAAGHLPAAVLDPEAGQGARPGSREAPAERRPYRRFRSAAGRDILVGRGPKDNDALTFGVARGNDVWLHVRGVPGSHVVVPGTGGAAPDPETLLDAATLAVHFSRARGETVADVAWTFRKHVKKPKGAAPGRVLVSQERGVVLRLEPERLERLLAGEPG